MIINYSVFNCNHECVGSNFQTLPMPSYERLSQWNYHLLTWRGSQHSELQRSHFSPLFRCHYFIVYTSNCIFRRHRCSCRCTPTISLLILHMVCQVASGPGLAVQARSRQVHTVIYMTLSSTCWNAWEIFHVPRFITPHPHLTLMRKDLHSISFSVAPLPLSCLSCVENISPCTITPRTRHLLLSV
jgi:hypothetical protein